MDFDAAFDGDVVAPAATPEPAPAPVAEAPPAPAAEPSLDGPPRGPDGKFAPKASAEPAPAVEAAPAPAPTPEPAAPQAPADDELTKLRAQVEGLNRALTSERAQRRQTSHAPDPEQDPEAFEAHHERETALTFEWSFRALTLTKGEETAKAVAEWARDAANADPDWYERALRSPDPAGFAHAEYQRDKVMQRMMDPDFFSKFEAFATSANTPNPAPAITVAPPSPPSTPPRSLASSPNAGGAQPGAIPTGPNVAFDTTFKD